MLGAAGREGSRSKDAPTIFASYGANVAALRASEGWVDRIDAAEDDDASGGYIGGGGESGDCCCWTVLLLRDRLLLGGTRIECEADRGEPGRGDRGDSDPDAYEEPPWPPAA